MMPHWDNPAGFWLAAGALPVIALYLLRHRRPPRKLPSLFLFVQTERDQKAAKTWRKLVPELSLFLQLLVLALLAITAAKPSWDKDAGTATSLAIVLDVSASMATRETPSERRIDQAKTEATALLHEHAGSKVLLIFAGAEPRLAAGQDASTVAGELAAIDAEDVGGGLEKAVALAEEKLRGKSGPRIVVLTDVGSPFETARPAVRVKRFGAPHDNVAVFGARASRTDARSLEISAVVVSFADAPREATLTLRALATPAGERLPEGPPADVRKVQLVPRVRTPVRFTVPAAGAEGAYEIALLERDALDRDDRTACVVPGSVTLPVVVVGRQANTSTVARALLADEHLAMQLVTPEEHARVDVAPDALEIFLDGCPGARKGRDALVFGPQPGRCLDVDVAEPSAEIRTLNGFRGNDPRVRFLSLDDVHAEHATTLRPRGGEGILAEDRRGALIVDASSPSRLVTLVGFSAAASDFASKRSFVIFLRNVTELAERHRTRAGRTELRAGEASSLAVPEDVQALTLDGAPLQARGGDVVISARPRAGLAILRWTDPRPAALLVPVQPGDVTESDLRAAQLATPPEARAASTPAARWATTHLHLLLAVCMLLLLTLELVVFGATPGLVGVPMTPRTEWLVGVAVLTALGGALVRRWHRERPFRTVSLVAVLAPTALVVLACGASYVAPHARLPFTVQFGPLTALPFCCALLVLAPARSRPRGPAHARPVASARRAPGAGVRGHHVAPRLGRRPHVEERPDAHRRVGRVALGGARRRHVVAARCRAATRGAQHAGG